MSLSELHSMVAICMYGNMNGGVMYSSSRWWCEKKLFVEMNHSVCYK